MSDVTQSSERAMRPLHDESGSSSSDSGLIRTKIEQSPSPPLRPSSPEAACPICLEDINNSSVTNSCAHRFCFTCLCEWSKVKPECPLCKQRFTIIFHTIKSMIDFQEYRLDQALLEPRLDPPRIFLALQQGSRPAFGYRTTMGFHGFETRVSSRSRMMLVAHGLIPPGSRVSSGGFTSSSLPNSTGRVSSSANRSTLEFRRNVYRHNLWVRPSPDQDRVRESSPEFYRMNPATTHRLAVWLSRELTVLLESNLIARENACRGILNLLYTYRIDSPDFRHLVQPQIGDRTQHFAHEFYHFAISPHDLPAYDAHARYVNGTEDGAADEPSIDAPIDEFGRPFLMADQGGYPALHGSSATMELNDHIRSVAHGLFADLRHTARQIVMNRNRRAGAPLSSFVDMSTNLRRSSVSPPLPLLRPERSLVPEVISLSSDEENLADAASDDSDVQIIGTLPPHHLRPPLEITDSDDSDVIMIPVPPPPIIVIDDDADEPSAVKTSPPSSPVSQAGGPSTSNGGEGPSTLNGVAPTEKRSARFTRPFYCEFSSSSDDNSDAEHAQPKKSSPTKRKTRPKKRLRNYKSSKYVDDGLDSASGEDKAETAADKDEVSDEADDTSKRAPNKKSGRSRKNSASSSKASRKKERQSSTSSSQQSCTSRTVALRTSKTRKSVSSRKDPVDQASSDDDDACSQCGGRSRNQQLVSECKARRKRRCSCACRLTKKKRRRSILSSAGDSSQASDSSRAAAPVIEKPKALSKKDIILNKRRSELSTIMNPDTQGQEDASLKRRPAFNVDVLGDNSRSTVKSTETDDDKSNDTILSMGQEYTTLATVSNASTVDALSGASFSSSHRQEEPYETTGDMSPPNLRRFDDTTACGAFAPYYPRSSSSASTSTSSSSLSTMVRGGPPRLKSIVVRPTPTCWSPKSQPWTCTDDSNDGFDF